MESASVVEPVSSGRLTACLFGPGSARTESSPPEPGVGHAQWGVRS